MRSTSGPAWRGLTVLIVPAAMLIAFIPSSIGAKPAADDPLFDRQWGLEQINAPEAWGTSRGRGVVIGIIDSGVDYQHPDLKDRLVQGVSVCGEKLCGNGDWDGRTSDDPGCDHGTHVAGIAAATADNGIGIAGVAPKASIMSVDVSLTGCDVSNNVGLGMDWAVDHGANVLNLSLGATAAAQVIDDFTGFGYRGHVEYALSKDVVIVAAAGNYSAPLCNTPSYIEGVLCVISTDEREVRTYYSSLGLKEDNMSVSAPGGHGLRLVACGEDVVSTIPVGTGLRGCGYPDASYAEKAGTSMASPHVAGVAALLRALGCSASQTTELITSTARDPISGQRGRWSPHYGYGIVDAEAAVLEAEDACAPSGVGEDKKDPSERSRPWELSRF